MRRDLEGDLVLVMVAALVAEYVALLDVQGPLRVAVGLAAAFVLPGYAISLTLVPRREVDAIERLALAVALSLALLIVLAPVLDLTSGVTARPLVFATTVVTLTSVLLASWRPRPVLERAGPRAGTSSRGILRAVLLTPAALIMAFVAAAVVLTMAAQPSRPTEFFATGSAGYADSYPRVAEAGAETMLSIGIASYEASRMSYRVVATADRRVLSVVEPIIVDPGQTWTGNLALVLDVPGDQTVTIDLLRSGDDAPYRSLRIWVEVLSGG